MAMQTSGIGAPCSSTMTPSSRNAVPGFMGAVRGSRRTATPGVMVNVCVGISAPSLKRNHCTVIDDAVTDWSTSGVDQPVDPPRVRVKLGSQLFVVTVAAALYPIAVVLLLT